MKIRNLFALLLTLIFVISAVGGSVFATTVNQSQNKEKCYILGNTPNAIVGGGILHNDGYAVSGNAIYANAFSSDTGLSPTIISSGSARNLNVMDGTLFFSKYNSADDTTSIQQIENPGKEEQTENTIIVLNGKIRQMYVVKDGNTKYILYTYNDGLYKLDYSSDNATSTLLERIPVNYGLVATISGYIFYEKDADGYYNLYADRSGNIVSVSSQVVKFSVIDYNSSATGKVELFYDETSFTTTLSSIFGTGKIVFTPVIDEVCENIATNSFEDAGALDNSEIDDIDTSRTTYTMAKDIIYNGSAPATTQKQKNIIKRAKQLMYIKWHCLSDFELYDDASPFYGNNDYHGIPYGQSGSISQYVGDWSGATSLNAFVQATATSSFYTSSGVRIADCSSFVSYAWNLSTKHTTTTLPGVATLVGDFTSANATETLNNLQVGDCLDVKDGSSRHCILIGAIRYADDGTLKQIVTYEQRKWTAGSKRNICVYDVSVPATETSWVGYKDYSHCGYAMPLSALIMRMQQEKPNKYKAYRLKSSYSVSYTYNSNAVVGLNTPQVSVNANGINSAKLTWSAITNAQKYQIVFSESESGPFTTVANVTTTSYTTTKLNGYYKVRALYHDAGGPGEYDVDIKSSYSDVVAVDNRGDAPQNVSVQFSGSNVILSWGIPTNGSGTLTYRVYASSSFNGSYTLLGSTTNTSFTHSNVSGKKYYKICVYYSSQVCVPAVTAVYMQSNGTGRLLGDVNGDNVINTGDTVLLLNYINDGTELTTDQAFCGDVNFDGTINTADTTILLKYISEMDTLPNWSTINKIL